MMLTAHPKSKSVQIADETKQYLEKKLSKFTRYFRNEPEIQFVQNFERGHHIAEITLHGDDVVLRAQERHTDLKTAIDHAANKLENQLTRFKSKRIDAHRQVSAVKAEAEAAMMEPDLSFAFDPQIVRRKSFAVQSMSPADAAQRMELLGHSFFLFKNDETGKASVLYRRESGDYGLIEPTL
jgi:putative sigma-54 modulation protein